MLKPGGVYVVVSYRPPSSRIRFFKESELGWSISSHKLYRPDYETEKIKIKQEFVSKKVMEELEKHKEVEKSEENLDEEPMEFIDEKAFE